MKYVKICNFCSIHSKNRYIEYVYLVYPSKRVFCEDLEKMFVYIGCGALSWPKLYLIQECLNTLLKFEKMARCTNFSLISGTEMTKWMMCLPKLFILLCMVYLLEYIYIIRITCKCVLFIVGRELTRKLFYAFLENYER